MARTERVSEGESGGDGAERVMKLDHVGPGGPVRPSDFTPSEAGAIGGSVQRRLRI